MILNTNSILIRLDESRRAMLEEENGKSWNVLEWDCAIRVIFTFTIYPFFVKHYAICGNWRRQWYPTPEFLPGKSHGWWSLVGCSPWGREQSDTTERLHFHFSLSCIGEGNGNPLQCSCLENPRVRGAWWAAMSGITQSQTRLKQLISSKMKAANPEEHQEKGIMLLLKFV